MNNRELERNIQDALETMDHPRLNELAVQSVWNFQGAFFQRTVYRLVTGLDHEQRHFWLEEDCPCGE